MRFHLRFRGHLALAGTFLLAAASSAPASTGEGGGEPIRAVEVLERAWPEHPEWVAMLADILQGSQLSAEDGWFRKAVAHSRYDWDGTRAQLDRDDDGLVAPDEFPGPPADFARLDRDGDGRLTATDFDFTPHALTRTPGMMMFFRADADGNGKLTPGEIEAYFARGDRGEAGFLSLSELQSLLDPPPPARAEEERPAPRSLWKRLSLTSDSDDGPSRLTLLKGLFTQEIGSLQPGPSVGEPAPDFALRGLAGAEVRLADLVGPKPVVLVFGNFTCGPFRSQAGNVEKVYRAYKDRATFVMIYVREAHPTDGWVSEGNARVGVSLPQPTSDAERLEVARTCAGRLGLGFPMLVDSLNDRVGARYSGMPSRLYVIDRAGTIAYKSGRGPFGFKPREMEQSLLMVLAEPTADRTASIKVGEVEADDALFPLLDNDEAWRRLPVEHDGPAPTLPSWARALAHSLPGTAAAMLDLDSKHRARSPIDPALRGMIRLVAADVNRSPYGLAYAEADLRRAGIGDEVIRALNSGDLSALPDAERAALTFARKMTASADTVSDAEVARLLADFGERKVVAMVLLLAYANFQDRLLLALDLPVEPGGPLPPAGGPPRRRRRRRDPAPPRAALGRRPAPGAISGGGPGVDRDERRRDPRPPGRAEGEPGPHPRAVLGGGRRGPAPRLPGPHQADPNPVEPGLHGATSPNWPPPGRPAPAPTARRRSPTASSTRAFSGS